jgi:hypothetical protein
MRSSAQSPPPITLPARAVPTGVPTAGHECTTSSAAALLAEYGSLPPRKASSAYGAACRTSYTLSVVITTVAASEPSRGRTSSTRAVPSTLERKVVAGSA